MQHQCFLCASFAVLVLSLSFEGCGSQAGPVSQQNLTGGTGGAFPPTGGNSQTSGGAFSTGGGATATGGGPDTGGSAAGTGGNLAGAGGNTGTAGSTSATAGAATGGAPPAGTGGAALGGAGGTGSAPAAGGSSATGGVATGGAAGDAAGGTSTGGQSLGRTSTQLIESLTLGWNLGNSLDAPEGETAWGNPTVTRELLEAVADNGFDLVRIPVTWSMHTGAAPGYVIEPGWISRVREVVRYATDAGLYVIINLHHDGADAYDGVEWITLNDSSGAVTEANNAAVRGRFVAVWRQIADHFEDFGDKLLFESLNEIHDGYDAPDPAYYEIINDLNQAFVDTVRSSGGNNAERHLVVPGYNTNIEYTLAGFAAPQDTIANRITLSVHYYDPWNYAGAASTHVWGQTASGNDGWGQEDYVVEKFDALKAAYVDQGIPVIIGEYGAVQQDGYEDYRRYYMEYVTKAAVDRGMLPVYWDNGGTGSGEDAFGLIDRTGYAVLHPTILEAMQRAATSSYPLSDIAVPPP